MGAIANDWLVPLSAEFKKPYYASLYKKVVEEYTTHVVYPPSDEIFTAGVEIPPSLVNIYKELHEDLGCYIPDNGYLVKWANQGVLMLNTLLTVRAHQAFSHKGIGWEQFTDAAIEALARQDRPMVFILWGRPAQSKKPMIYNSKHLILESAHPSPLSAYRGFFGSRPFSRTNEYLKENGLAPIDWQIENRM